MYTGKVFLTNKNRTPLSLTNDFDDTFNMIDEIKDCEDISKLTRIADAYSFYRYWKVDRDDKDETRLSSKDNLGNVHYFICKKQKLAVPKMNSNSVKEMFPDWENIESGEWSKYGKRLYYGRGHFVEIGLYREPMENEEYANTYTLQIFDGDDVIFCAKVDDEN